MSVLQFVTSGIAASVLSTAGFDIILYIFTILDTNKKLERAHRLEIEMMAKYQKELEETVALRTSELKVANEVIERRKNMPKRGKSDIRDVVDVSENNDIQKVLGE